ncbi:MAG: efflux RND transporter permease subunit [Planctomycetes bacterium]|nr:efflux RND transporter permease subunit [Planctomycetota bacterium]
MTQAVLKNPYLVLVLAAAILVLGVFTYPKIPKDLLPIFETSAVQIVTFYPGMPPEIMEKDIMSRMQRWTGQSVGIEHQEAKAMTGVCIVKDFFREGISLETAMAQTTSYAMSDMFYLPPGTIPPMLMPIDPTASLPLCLVVVDSPGMDEQQLYDIAYYELRNKLQSIQGVISPAVFGGKLRRIYAYMDPRKLEAYELTLMDVQNQLAKYNVLIPAGNMKVGEQDFQLFTNAVPETIEDLNDSIIKMIDGVPVKISDIGRVENASQIQSNIVRINGSRKAYIPIYRQPGANSIEIVDTIQKNLAKILVKLKNERAGDVGMDELVLSVAMDQSGPVKESIEGLQYAAGLGALLAGLVVFAFLRSLTSTFIVVLVIPLAVLASVVGLYFTKNTINSMTLGGLALAIGILVDQAIVVLENIVRHVRMGKTAPQAALEGTQEVTVPIFISTVTFAVVFFPTVFLSGLASFLFTPLALATIFAIIVSFLLSITLVPAYCAKYLDVKALTKNVASAQSEGPLLVAFGKLVAACLRIRWIVALGSGVLAAVAIFVATQMGQEMIPAIDAGQFTIYVRMPSGANIDQTDSRIQEIEAAIIEETGEPDPSFALGPEHEKIPESDLQILISNIGVLNDWPAAYTPNIGPGDAFMLVQLKGKSGRPGAFDFVDTLREKLNRRFPDVEFAFDTGGMLSSALNMGEPSPIHFQVSGSNLEEMREIAEQVETMAKSVEGTVDVRIAQRLDYPTMTITMNRDKAARMGLTPEVVMQNLVSATNSSVGFDPAFWVDKSKGNHYFIGVQYPEELLTNLDTILNIPIGMVEGVPIRLRNVATIEKAEGPGVVNHRNIGRVMDIYVNLARGYDAGSVMTAIEAKILAPGNPLGATVGSDDRGELFDLAKYPGLAIRSQGEVKEMRKSFDQFTAGLLIAVVLVYLVMVAQFRSWVDPLVILLTVPLGFIGVVAALTLTGSNLSIMSFMGIIMMVGIVVEYSIVLVDFANERLREGMSIQEAIVDAAKVRVRPILMTSLTTWLALLPMATGWFGGDANAPLAQAIIGGVIAATVLSLLVVPCLYVIFKQQHFQTQSHDNPIDNPNEDGAQWATS